MESPEMTELSLDDRFEFSCYPGISCFNSCCRDLTQFLTPYDVLRLKNHFSMHSGRFLELYTVMHTGPQTGLPIITLKPADNKSLACPFVKKEGCSVYKNRPSSCRMYPLARMLARSRETGRVTARYMLLKEPHCRGFENGSSWSVREWIEDQGLLEYNEMNDAMMELIAFKNQHLPGPLPRDLAGLFYTFLYDLDSMREMLAGDRAGPEIPASGAPDPRRAGDEDLLLFSLKFVFEKIRVTRNS